jgi:hypothetical protein
MKERSREGGSEENMNKVKSNEDLFATTRGP